jgi:hypothetical protein
VIAEICAVRLHIPALIAGRPDPTERAASVRHKMLSSSLALCGRDVHYSLAFTYDWIASERERRRPDRLHRCFR